MRQVKFGGSAPVAHWLVFLCLALVLASAAVQALHFHLDGLATDAKHCPVCPVLHSAATVAPACHPDIAFKATAFLNVRSCSDHDSILAWSTLFSRPPPLT
ncbi:MAG: hypothetical protein LAP21_02530 [Acidobacteriia bacterium]|nr:hypothetical protein [Terriglobia bacterium]